MTSESQQENVQIIQKDVRLVYFYDDSFFL